MAFFARHRMLRESLALLTAITLSACATWQREAGSPQALIAGRPDQIRVILVQGDTLVLHDPTVLGDTLFGTVHRGIWPERTSVMMREVQSIDTQKATVGGALVGTLVVVGIIAVIMAGSANLTGSAGGGF